MRLRRNEEPDRVRRYSTAAQLQQIDAHMRERLRQYAGQPADVIRWRINELRAEWSIERYLQLFATAGLLTCSLAVMRNRKWGYASCAGLAFFLFHALDGFDLPVPLLRQLGIRTRREIDWEIYALKALRGDFAGIDPERRRDADQAEQAAIAAGLT